MVLAELILKSAILHMVLAMPLVLAVVRQTHTTILYQVVVNVILDMLLVVQVAYINHQVTQTLARLTGGVAVLVFAQITYKLKPVAI